MFLGFSESGVNTKYEISNYPQLILNGNPNYIQMWLLSYNPNALETEPKMELKRVILKERIN